MLHQVSRAQRKQIIFQLSAVPLAKTVCSSLLYVLMALRELLNFNYFVLKDSSSILIVFFPSCHTFLVDYHRAVGYKQSRKLSASSEWEDEREKGKKFHLCCV
jgi:hypothetical protein